jgi:hypothetical protein
MKNNQPAAEKMVFVLFFYQTSDPILKPID